MADPKVIKTIGIPIAAEFGEAVVVGNLVYWDTTNDDWRKADADSIATYAQAIVHQVFDSTPADGSFGTIVKECYLVDKDAPFAEAPDTYYLSTTAGAYTTTRPTGNNDLCQVVGEVISSPSGTYASETAGTDGALIHLKINEPYEVTQYVPFSAYIAATTALAVLDSKSFTGPSALAANDAAYASAFIPDNAISLVTASAWFGNEAIIQAATTITATIDAGANSESHDAVEDTITTIAITNATTDELNEFDLSTGLDATGLFDAGNIVGIKLNKAAEAAGGEDPVWIGVQLVFLCV